MYIVICVYCDLYIKSIYPFAMVSFETKTGQFLGEMFLKASWILGILKP